MIYYATIENIQHYINKFYIENKMKISFPDAIYNMLSSGNLREEYVNHPDIVSLYSLSDNEFLDSLKSFNLVIEASATLEVKDYIAEGQMIPQNRDSYIIYHFDNIINNWHKHDFFEIDYVFKDSCVLKFENEQRILNEGDCCIIAPFSKHALIAEKKLSNVISIMIRKSTFHAVFFKLLSQKDILSNFFRAILFDTSKSNYLLFRTNNSIIIRQIIRSLIIETHQEDNYSNFNSNNLISILLTNILRNYSDSTLFSHFDELNDFSEILQQVQYNYSTIKLSELAEKFHYTVPYLSSLFKKNTGYVFKDLVKSLRMADAADYIINTNMSISQISELLGYNSSDHFREIFRSFYNQSPTQYRKKNKLENKK